MYHANCMSLMLSCILQCNNYYNLRTSIDKEPLFKRLILFPQLVIICSKTYTLPTLQLETDGKELHKVITISIKNQLGVRVGLFTPDMAFEDVVKDQIRKLVQPAMKCIDMVSTELGEVVQKCGDGVSHSLSLFPYIIISTHTYIHMYSVCVHSCT